MNHRLFVLGLVCGRAQNHPLRTLVALIAFLGRGVIFLARFSGAIACLLYRGWQAIDGPAARGITLVASLILLANTLLDSDVAGWAMLLIVGASRSLFSASWSHTATPKNRSVSVPIEKAGLRPFDEATFVASLDRLSDRELRCSSSVTEQQRFGTSGGS